MTVTRGQDRTTDPQAVIIVLLQVFFLRFFKSVHDGDVEGVILPSTDEAGLSRGNNELVSPVFPVPAYQRTRQTQF